MFVAQQFVGGVTVDHGHAQPLQFAQSARLRALFLAKNNNREVEVGAGEGQVLLAFGGGHQAGQQVQLTGSGIGQHFAPVLCGRWAQSNRQALFNQAHIVGG